MAVGGIIFIEQAFAETQPLTTISGLPVMSKMVLMTAAPATMRSDRSLDSPAIFLRLALVRVVISWYRPSKWSKGMM